MGIMVECSECYGLNSLRNFACWRCEFELPRGEKRVYWVQWSDAEKRWRSKRVGLTTELIARRVLKKRTEAVRKQKNDALFAKVTFADLAEAYILGLERKGAVSTKDAQRCLQRMIFFWGGKTLVKCLTPDMIHQLQLYLRRKRHSRSYVDRHVAVGRAAWNTLFLDRPNPFSRAALSCIENRVVNLVSREDEERLFAAAREQFPRLWQIMVVSLGTGLRQGKVRTLTWRQVDFERGVIWIEQKGRGRHELPMSSAVRWVLSRIAGNDSRYVWPSPRRRDKPIGSVRKSWSRCKELAGITQPLRLHDLRHWTATKILAATSDLKAVKETLGHSDVRTTAHLYERFIRSNVKDAVESIPIPMSAIPVERCTAGCEE